MADQPIVVLQTQRMGDLIMTYPLLLWLARTYPGHPLVVVAEPQFAHGLARLSPAARYVAMAGAEPLTRERCRLVINLSIRPEAATLAGRLSSEAVVGPVAEPSGVTRIHGDWQLYRASVVQNNRHNRFHWADLNALDVIPTALMAATAWPAPRRPGPGKAKVGLVVGASQPEKRPPAAFIAALARELARRGLLPVLLGGPEDRELADRVKAAAGIKLADACGRLTLPDLARLGQDMALCITPDTGPMHLAAWTGWPILNLSVGPVNPYETGPYQPGHHVLRRRLSCRGCWECAAAAPPCRQGLDPARVAYAAMRLARGEAGKLAAAELPGLELLATGRDGHGLYDLTPLCSPPVPDARELLGSFWKACFGHLFGLFPEAEAKAAFDRLATASPRLAAAVRRSLAALSATLGRGMRRALPDARFQDVFPPHTRPLAGYIERVLQNGDYALAARRRSAELLSRVAALAASS